MRGVVTCADPYPPGSKGNNAGARVFQRPQLHRNRWRLCNQVGFRDNATRLVPPGGFPPAQVDCYPVPPKPYALSFSAGGLLYHESVSVAESYIKFQDWSKAITYVRDENLLQSRVEATTTRKVREIGSRLKELTQDQLDLLCNGSRLEQNYLLWLACCKRYQLIRDFAMEVLHSKFLSLDLVITTSDIERFFDAKSVWHSEIEELAETTRQKLITVIMRMLREAGMVSNEGLIQPRMVSPELVRVIGSESWEQFKWFPVAESDVKRLLDRAPIDGGASQ